jgi:hypothetical protein
MMQTPHGNIPLIAMQHKPSRNAEQHYLYGEDEKRSLEFGSE